MDSRKTAPSTGCPEVVEGAEDMLKVVEGAEDMLKGLAGSTQIARQYY